MPEEFKLRLRDISPKKHICVSQQFTPEYLLELFALAAEMEKNQNLYSEILKNKIICLLFYEPSTRTRLSFESAANRLGAKCLVSENAAQFSSAVKGETIEDTMEMINNYADFVVVRHPEDDVAYKIINSTKIPYINAGTGKTQHPTQSLLDVYTIYQNFQRLDNLKICLCGDLLRGRTVDSLVYLLSKFKNNKFYFVSPENSRIKEDLKIHLNELQKINNLEFVELDNLINVLPDIDILYMTRIQKERFDNPDEYELAKGKFILNLQNVSTMKEQAIILHPLPRIDEIAKEVDADPRAKYFQQAKNGVYIRMALLKILNDNTEF